jgi:hypothetical protein
MALEMMKELFGVAHVRNDEKEVPNVKRMRVVEEEVSLSQPVTVAVSSGLHQFLLEEEFPLGTPAVVPPKEEEVPVPQGPSVTVPPKEEVPPEEQEFLGPVVMVPPEEEEVPAA